MNKNIQIHSNKTHPAFGEVNVQFTQQSTLVSLTLLMEPEIEGMQTGLALDGSSSMQSAYGRIRKSPPASVFNDLIQRGMMTEIFKDGKKTYRPSAEAIAELKANGHWNARTDNIVTDQAREMTAYLAENIDEDGGTTVLYWACGDGRKLENPVDLTAEDCKGQTFEGPTEFGEGTYLVPAMKYFVDRFQDANYGFYVFMTDGAIDDFEEVKAYTIKLAREIEAGSRNMVKCVLIGIGDQINRDQMEELDDLETGTEVDIWDHKVSSEMRNMMDIFAEVVDANMVIAPEGKVFDHQGQLAHHYQNGLPAALEFELPPGATHFVLEVGDMKVQQDLS